MGHHGPVTVSIRLAAARDAPRLAHVAAVTFPLACPPGTALVEIARFVTTHLSAERFAEYVADPGRTVLVAVDEETDAVVAYAMLVEGDPSDDDVARAVAARPTVELSKFYVMPDRHGQGVAARLMAAVFEAAVTDGAGSVWLGVNTENDRARAFYAGRGFEEVGTRRFVVGGRTHDDLVLECEV
jgi:ribosomal protein S18 acetylase RimI-like enzyme